jgi:hypothetical protein
MKTNALLSTRLLIPALSVFFAMSASAVTIVVDDYRPGHATLSEQSTTLGSVSTSAPTTVFPTTYTLTNLDLTSVGGGLTDQIVFSVAYSQTGGTGVQVNGFGNISVTGDDDNQVGPGESLTATVSLSSTTFSGGLGELSIGFTSVEVGGVNTTEGSEETWNILNDGTTVAANGFTDGITYSLASSSFLTLQDVAKVPTTGDPTINLQGFDVTIVAVPEPSAAALIGLAGLALILRRRR